jgi:signal transduction histidine kinase/CheY-like chemotaxis protein/HPt (histidine-containing phosphotransfer) domain-containing protein
MTGPLHPDTMARTHELFAEDYGAVSRRVDRLFAGLFVFQAVAAIAAALFISPLAWKGVTSSTHLHVWAAVILGSLIASLPVVLAVHRPGHTLTRHVVAVGQMLTSALLIHLLGGRIETHFHVFGSLAFLSFYRDWRVLMSATVVVALDHMIRGVFWPQSVYGVSGGAEWRWLEHAGWVVFENTFLVLSCAQGIREMKAIALRQAQIETKNIALAETTRRAEAAAEAKGQFLANMSHEIRTPLNGVIGMADLLSHTRLDAEQAKYAGLIQSSAGVLLGLISDILDFSKIEAGRLELESIEFDPRTLVEEVGELLSPRAAEKGLELLCRVAPDVPRWVRGDPGRLRQVLLNLASNAVKFTDRGEVVISATFAAGSVRFAVRDSGIGVPPDRLDRLFRKFSQVDDSNTRKYGGTGLGLAISKQLIELMNGRIGVESEMGKGSTFWAEVPLKVVNKDCAVPAPDALRGLRVLIVDDNSTNREILAEQCRSWGFDSTLAEDGPRALRLIEDSPRPFSLVILDMQMPGMTGAEVAHAIRRDLRCANTRILILSSIDAFDEGPEAPPCDSRLVKPVRQSDLFNSIVRTMNPARPPVPRSETAPKAPSRAAISGRPIRAVLAEDNAVNQIVAREMLKDLGVSCVTAENGRKAVEAIRAGGVRVVLMDCQMPEMDGFEATRELRRLEQNGPSGPGNPSRLPVIALTANAVKGDRERCLDAGMDDYVSKPIDRDELARAIENAVRMSRQAANVATETLDQSGSSLAPLTAPTPPPASVPASEAINYTDLLRRCMGKQDIVLAVLDAMSLDLPQRLGELQSAAEAGRLAEMARTAHALKGAAANASAEGVRRLAMTIEDAAAGSRAGEIDGALAELRGEIDRCARCIESIKAGALKRAGVTEAVAENVTENAAEGGTEGPHANSDR